MAEQMPKSAGDALANNKPILTLRQAKRYLGKATSDAIGDIDLMRTVALLSYLVYGILDEQKVPKSKEV